VTPKEPFPPDIRTPLDQLERSLVHEYLLMRGHDEHSLSRLTEPERHELLKQASSYASGKLSEVELRSRFAHGLHEAVGDVPKSNKA
jgi:hypothetical protein